MFDDTLGPRAGGTTRPQGDRLATSFKRRPAAGRYNSIWRSPASDSRASLGLGRRDRGVLEIPVAVGGGGDVLERLEFGDVVEAPLDLGERHAE
jgi:hypothetical protein